MGDFLRAALGIAALFAVVHVALAVGLYRASARLRALSPTARSDLLVQLMWLLGCSPLPFMYAAALPQLAVSVETRWKGTSALVERAMLLHFGSSLYEVGVYLLYGKPWAYTVHHAIALWGYGLGLWTGAHHFWAAWAGLVEITNVNVGILKICLILQVGRGSSVEAANGAVLYVLYLLVRVLSLPCLLAVYAHDLAVHHEHTWGAPASRPLVWLRLTTWPSVLAIWVLSCAWFAPIHRGMLKVLRGADPLEGADDAIARNVGGAGEKKRT